MIRNSMKMLLAILLGNLVYFLIAPFLPDALTHNIFQLDAGLLLDMTTITTTPTRFSTRFR